MGQRNTRFPFVTVVGIAIICGLISYQGAQAVSYMNQYSCVNDYAYLIFKDGSTINAKNGNTCQIDYTGTNASTVIQSAQDHMDSRELLRIKGDFNIPNSVNITNSINIIHQGIATLTGTGPYMIFKSSEQAKDVHVYIGEVDGQNNSRDCIKITSGVGHATMEFGLLERCDHAIYLDSSQGSAALYGDINFYGDIEDNNYAIFFDSPGGAGEVAREGIVFHGVIFGNTHGVYISSGNTLAGAFALGPDAVVDNYSIANSWDFEDYSQNALSHTLSPKFIRWSTVISKTYFVPYISGYGTLSVNTAEGHEKSYPFSSIWSTVTTGTAGSAPTYNPAVASLTTATSANSGRQIFSPTNFATNDPFIFNYHLAVTNMTNAVIRTGMVASGSSFISSDNTQGIQIKWDGTSWKVIVSDGNTSQSLDTTLTSADITVTMHYIPNKAVTVWVHGSSTKVVQTTSAPLPNSALVPFFNTLTSDAVSKPLSLQQYPKLQSLAI